MDDRDKEQKDEGKLKLSEKKEGNRKNQRDVEREMKGQESGRDEGQGWKKRGR